VKYLTEEILENQKKKLLANHWKMLIVAMSLFGIYFGIAIFRFLILLLIEVQYLTLSVFQSMDGLFAASIMNLVFAITSAFVLVVGAILLTETINRISKKNPLEQQRLKPLNQMILAFLVVSVVYLVGIYVHFASGNYIGRHIVYGYELLILVLVFFVLKELMKQLTQIKGKNKKKIITIQKIMLAGLITTVISYLVKLAFFINFYKNDGVNNQPIWELPADPLSGQPTGLLVVSYIMIPLLIACTLLTMAQTLIFSIQEKTLEKELG